MLSGQPEVKVTFEEDCYIPIDGRFEQRLVTVAKHVRSSPHMTVGRSAFSTSPGSAITRSVVSAVLIMITPLARNL